MTEPQGSVAPPLPESAPGLPGWYQELDRGERNTLKACFGG